MMIPRLCGWAWCIRFFGEIAICMFIISPWLKDREGIKRVVWCEIGLRVKPG